MLLKWKYSVNDTVVTLRSEDGTEWPLSLCQKWPIRSPRPIGKRLPTNVPLITGQRVIDTLFPIAKGGAAAVPGGFGTGKTMTQHQLANGAMLILSYMSVVVSAEMK